MKKFNLILIISLLFLQYAAAQNKWAKYSQTFPSGFMRDSTQVGIVANIEERNNEFWSVTDVDALQKEILADTGFKTSRLNGFVFVATYSHTPAYFFIKNVNSKNAGEFEYRVLQDKHQVIVPWSPITHFSSPGFGAGDGIPGEMGEIGSYTAAIGHKLVVDVRRKGADTLTSTAVVSWVAVQPVVSNVFTANELNEFLLYLKHPWAVKQTRTPQYQTDPATKQPKLTFKATENNLIFYLTASVTDRKQIEYEVIKDNKVYIPWKTNDFDNCFIWLKKLPHGNYQLKIRYTVQPEHVATYDFIIKPAWYQTTMIKVIASSLLAAFLALIVWLLVLLKQKRKSANEIANKTKLQLELQIIRSQLNPHFIFNALSSIQGLINKKDVLSANTYLSEFAGLLRNTLVDNNQEQIPLDKEIKTLETYIKLEQLRFNFKYEINIDTLINIYETEIPSLLLQPLLENAIKHGVADLNENGLLILDITRNNNDMLVVVKDNGKGFAETHDTAGYGLKLTRGRIEILNSILNGQKITILINPVKNEFTEIHLTFINWFNEN